MARIAGHRGAYTSVEIRRAQNMCWRSLSCLIILVALTTQARSAERPPYTPEQLSLIREVTECRISPDGKTVAFVSDITGALELWTVAATGGWPSQLTNLNE